jgi:Putative transposase
VATIDSKEFIRRFLLHVPPRGFVKIRHFGILSNRLRGLSVKLCRMLIGTPQTTAAGDSQPRAEPCSVCRIGILWTVALLSAYELEIVSRTWSLDSS